MPTVADVAVSTLRASGVKRVYGLPGDSLNGFTDALRRNGSIAWQHVRHEEAASFAAAGEAAVTGQLAVCVGSCGHRGPGRPRGGLPRDGDGSRRRPSDLADVIGDQAQWLQEGMKVILSIFNETPVGIQLPPRVTLEIIETEPAMKGQTASSSYKPAKVANGARVMVPPHISPGTRIVIQTEDGSYVERAKD